MKIRMHWLKTELELKAVKMREKAGMNTTALRRCEEQSTSSEET